MSVPVDTERDFAIGYTKVHQFPGNGRIKQMVCHQPVQRALACQRLSPVSGLPPVFSQWIGHSPSTVHKSAGPTTPYR